MPIRTYTHKELAIMYHVSPRTLTRWVKPIIRKHAKRKRIYKSAEVEFIFRFLGPPDNED